MDPSLPPAFPPSLDGVPYEQKWELLKPTIERLYVHENRKLSDVIKAIKGQLEFDAVESQYKYQIKKWKLKKNTSTSKKIAIYKVVQKRAELGKSTAVIRRGQAFDTKNLRRYVKTERRRAITLQPGAGEPVTDVSTFSGRLTQSVNRIFMNWNMPYGTMASSGPGTVDPASPLSDIVVTPPPSPRGAPSAMTVAVREMTAMERARLFVQGRQMDLLKSLKTPQRIILSTWMYQYWLFAFKTAKYWGRGPQDWTASILGFNDYPQRKMIALSLPNTPAAYLGTPASQPTPRKNEIIEPTFTSAEEWPSSLCGWSIHSHNIKDDQVSSQPRPPPQDLNFNEKTSTSTMEDFNFNDEESWPAWPTSPKWKEYTEKLSDNLESNEFSSVSLGELPIAADQIAKAARCSPNELFEEALGFGIMTRRTDLVIDHLRKVGDRLETAGLYPFHLAVTYLDGSKTCCIILEILEVLGWRDLRKLYVNGLGHTVLDQLMIAILKAHTSCLPGVVDAVFKEEKRFEGEEVDICGRWDADSDCVRTLLANGRSAIPFEWKHMFCHTSVQAICHCIGTVFGPFWSPDINTPSGLFLRRCSHCGLKLQLLPLHTLVLTGLHLSRSGCQNETLFGILACLLCLLSNGANPLLKANISIQALLGNGDVNQCNHERLDPAEFAERVPNTLRSMWSRELSSGWRVICSVLRHSQAEWKVGPSKGWSASNGGEHSDEFDFFTSCTDDEISVDEEASNEPHLPAECPNDESHENFFGSNKVLASLWAAVQTELLTYRRLEEGDEWLSHNFDMHALDEGLISRGEVDIALVQKDMMKPFCDCGRFLGATPACPTMYDAMAYYFSNFNKFDWRNTNIESPVGRSDRW